MKTKTTMTENVVENETVEIVPVVTTAAAVKVGEFLPKWATTPKRGRARKPKREPAALLAYAMEKGSKIDLTDKTVLADLEQRGIKSHRIANAVCGLKKFYGVPVTAERTGRQVTAYNVQLS